MKRQDKVTLYFDALEELDTDQPIDYKPMAELLKSLYYAHRKWAFLSKYCHTCGNKYPCHTRRAIEAKFWWYLP